LWRTPAMKTHNDCTKYADAILKWVRLKTPCRIPTAGAGVGPPAGAPRRFAGLGGQRRPSWRVSSGTAGGPTRRHHRRRQQELPWLSGRGGQRVGRWSKSPRRRRARGRWYGWRRLTMWRCGLASSATARRHSGPTPSGGLSGRRGCPRREGWGVAGAACLVVRSSAGDVDRLVSYFNGRLRRDPRPMNGLLRCATAVSLNPLKRKSVEAGATAVDGTATPLATATPRGQSPTTCRALPRGHRPMRAPPSSLSYLPHRRPTPTTAQTRRKGPIRTVPRTWAGVRHWAAPSAAWHPAMTRGRGDNHLTDGGEVAVDGGAGREGRQRPSAGMGKEEPLDVPEERPLPGSGCSEGGDAGRGEVTPVGGAR